MTILERELKDVKLNKEQVQKLKYRILEYKEKENAEQRDFYNSQELVELFQGEEVDRELILREANSIIKEEASEKIERKKKNVNTFWNTFAILFVAGIVAGYVGCLMEATKVGKNNYEEKTKYESIFNKRTELASSRLENKYLREN
jgi:hypothetical protein